MKRLHSKRKPSCPHRNWVVGATGGWHSAGGDVWDDVREYVICLDCHKVIERGWTWKQRIRRYHDLPYLPVDEVPF